MKQKFDIEDYTLTADQLQKKYAPGFHPVYTREAFIGFTHTVASIRSYWEWVFRQLLRHNRQ